MGGRSTGLVPVALLLASLTGAMAFSKNFVNSSLPDSKFTFVVNFDFSQVICQHSENKSDLHVHEMSILCDGKQDCFTNPAIHDESFPYCEKKCDSTCNNRGACLYDGERPQCYCNSGFSGPSCEFIDKNECLDRPCHLMADCLNTPVGFSCVCRPGFLGNGYHCADIDECSTRSLCPEHSNCVNLPGTHYCNCTEGFAQKGDSLLTKCLDINECELGSHNCGKNRLCENTIGGFNCVSGCTEGYDFVNGECVDVDECQREGICDPRAECFNSPGSYSCVCEDGMTGDGKRCEPITDCTQREDICDRHAQCIHPFKMCQCVAGFVGDGITCHDIDECEASVEPCKNQKGSRCVNIVGGHICCEEGSDDARCIEEKGVFCAGGCGTNAYCGNKTCECLPGYSGDPLKKCLDVNECDADNLCKGVGQWCVNIFGSFLCCEPSSKEPECQGVHIFKNSDGTTAVLHANHTKDVVVSAEQGENSVTQQGGFIAVGRGVLRANGSLPSISVLSRRACTSYCPINSECVAGYCECSKGFGGNPHLGCEDINECETGSPCGEITADNWCTNTEGGFTCCTRESPQYECQGLEITLEGGLREVGGNKDDKIFHENINETSTVDVFSQKLHQSQNASEGGAILIVKQATPTDITLLKPENGELGLEITGRGLESTATEATVTLPGIVSTLGGLSSTTTTIPVTEIPIHLPEDLSTTSLKGNRTSNTTVLIIPSTLKPVTELEGSGLEPDDERRTTTRLPSTLSGNINVHFTTLEEMTKDPNEPRTTVGESAETTKAPNTVIDGDETEEEALVNGKIPKKPKETTEGGKTGDVSVIDKLLGTTKKPTEKEPNPDKEGLEIIAKPTKPPTDVTTNKPSSSSESSSNNKENSSPKPKTSSAETSGNPVGSKETTSDKETGTVGSDKPDLGIDEEEKNGNGKDPKQPKTEGHNGRSSGGSSSSSSGTVVTVKEETKVGGDGQTLPEDAGRGVGITTPEQEGEAASTVPTTGETGLVIQWEGDKTTSGPSTESGPSSSIGSLLESTTVVSSESSTTTSPSEAKSANGESGQSFGTVVGKKDKPETDIHGGEGPETIQGEDGTKLTTVEPATTEEMGLEIIHEKTTSSLSVPDESSPGSTVFPTELTTSSPIISAPTEEKTTAGTVSVTIGSTETTTDGRTTEAGLEIIHETTPLTGQSTIQPKEEETTTREAETAGIEKTTKTEPPATTNGRDGETTAPALSAVEPTTTSAIEPEDAKEATLTSSSVGTTEGPALTAESSTKQTDLVLTVDTTTSSSSSSTKEESSPTTVTTSTEAASTPETGLEIVPEETTRSLESTTEQPDLVLTAGPTDAQTASSTLKEEPTTPPSTATTSSASSASPSTETTSTASSKGKTISSTQTAVPTAEGATPSTTAALISETASPSLGTKEATERPTSTLAAVSITPTDGTALPSSTTETPTTQPAVTELVSLNSGTTAAPTKTGSEQPPVNETTAGTATGGTAGPSSTSPNSQTPAVDITNLESTTRTPTADTSPNLSSETPAATSPSSAEGSASTSESSTLGTTDGTSALSSSTAPTSKGTTEGSTLKSSPETSETSVHPSTAAATSEVPSSSSATTEAATTQTQVADNQKETTGARGSSTTPVTPAITTEAATETTAGPSGQQTTVAKEPTVSSPGSVETSSTTTQPDLVLSVETTTTAEGTAPAGTKEESTTSAPSTAETFETAPGSIATKAPKKTVEVVTGGPDEDLTAAPTKQQRVPQTEFPAEPEGSTPWSTEEQTTKDVFSLPEKTTSPSATLGPSNVTKCVSSDECGDDALCERRTGACRCLPGFQGIPPSTPCSDVDECAEGLHKCHESARCHNIVGTYACFCPMGYRKNESGACIDIDECAESRGNCCSLNGTCVNKEGSYGCECKPGFFGDGYNCMPVEKRVCTEAELAKAGCGQHHVCMVDGLGGADCNTCKMGFKMVDGNCTDVNECAEPELNLCSRTADCNNLLGTYACSCKQGFRGDGYMCEDVDECGSNPCHPQAECENLLGSFKCSCPSGFTGDGIKECQNPLEKSCENVKDFCGRIEHVACLSVRIFNGSLSSVCECEPGFRFNKAQNTCEDINECEENRHNCDPASSVCVNEEGSFHCECAEGYEGVGGVCVDVNECERGTAGCHSMAMCLNQPGSCGCKCMQGFTGDGIQCNAVQKREEDNACTPEWDRLCMLENKTCHVDEEDVPQCGSCVEGHHPINGSCQPVHGAGTCSDPKKNTCDKNAECIDIPGTPGKHFCTCKKGFIGDGLRCDDIDECSLTGICHLHATCQNIPGSFNCSCNAGFTGNGFTCTKEAGPNCHLNGELCHKNAECTMDGQCKCKKGFEGDGFKECTEIASSPTTTAAVPSAETTTGKQDTTTEISPTRALEETTTERPLSTGTTLPSTSTRASRMNTGSVVEIESPEEVEMIPGSLRVNFTTLTTTTESTSSTTDASKATAAPQPPTSSQAPESKTTHHAGSTTAGEPVTSTVTRNASGESTPLPDSNASTTITEKVTTVEETSEPTSVRVVTAETTLTGFDTIDQRKTTTTVTLSTEESKPTTSGQITTSTKFNRTEEDGLQSTTTEEKEVVSTTERAIEISTQRTPEETTSAKKQEVTESTTPKSANETTGATEGQKPQTTSSPKSKTENEEFSTTDGIMTSSNEPDRSTEASTTERKSVGTLVAVSSTETSLPAVKVFTATETPTTTASNGKTSSLTASTSTVSSKESSTTISHDRAITKRILSTESTTTIAVTSGMLVNMVTGSVVEIEGPEKVQMIPGSARLNLTQSTTTEKMTTIEGTSDGSSLGPVETSSQASSTISLETSSVPSTTAPTSINRIEESTKTTESATKKSSTPSGGIATATGVTKEVQNSSKKVTETTSNPGDTTSFEQPEAIPNSTPETASETSSVEQTTKEEVTVEGSGSTAGDSTATSPRKNELDTMAPVVFSSTTVSQDGSDLLTSTAPVSSTTTEKRTLSTTESVQASTAQLPTIPSGGEHLPESSVPSVTETSAVQTTEETSTGPLSIQDTTMDVVWSEEMTTKQVEEEGSSYSAVKESTIGPVHEGSGETTPESSTAKKEATSPSEKSTTGQPPSVSSEPTTESPTLTTSQEENGTEAPATTEKAEFSTQTTKETTTAQKALEKESIVSTEALTTKQTPTTFKVRISELISTTTVPPTEEQKTETAPVDVATTNRTTVTSTTISSMNTTTDPSSFDPKQVKEATKASTPTEDQSSHSSETAKMTQTTTNINPSTEALKEENNARPSSASSVLITDATTAGISETFRSTELASTTSASFPSITDKDVTGRTTTAKKIMRAMSFSTESTPAIPTTKVAQVSSTVSSKTTVEDIIATERESVKVEHFSSTFPTDEITLSSEAFEKPTTASSAVLSSTSEIPVTLSNQQISTSEADEATLSASMTEIALTSERPTTVTSTEQSSTSTASLTDVPQPSSSLLTNSPNHPTEVKGTASTQLTAETKVPTITPEELSTLPNTKESPVSSSLPPDVSSTVFITSTHSTLTLSSLLSSSQKPTTGVETPEVEDASLTPLPAEPANVTSTIKEDEATLPFSTESSSVPSKSEEASSPLTITSVPIGSQSKPNSSSIEPTTTKEVPLSTEKLTTAAPTVSSVQKAKTSTPGSTTRSSSKITTAPSTFSTYGKETQPTDWTTTTEQITEESLPSALSVATTESTTFSSRKDLNSPTSTSPQSSVRASTEEAAKQTSIGASPTTAIFKVPTSEVTSTTTAKPNTPSSTTTVEVPATSVTVKELLPGDHSISAASATSSSPEPSTSASPSTAVPKESSSETSPSITTESNTTATPLVKSPISNVASSTTELPTERSTTIELTPPTSGLFGEATARVSPTVTQSESSPRDSTSVSVSTTSTLSTQSTQLFSSNGNTAQPDAVSPSSTPPSSASPPGMTPLSFETTEIMPTTEADAYGSTPESEESTTSRATSTKAVSTTTTSATTTTKAPSTVSDDGIEVRTEPAGWSEEKPLRQGNDGRCSADNRSQCHEFAICDLSTNSCRCKDGFKGDGYSSCTQIITSDCVSNSSICHSDAVCDQHTRKCSCNAGHLGDGILCSPDPQDCVFRKDLCSTDAICAGRRCHCIEGFTGDGVKCVSLHQRSSNCSECDANAHCDQSVCSCNLGYFGNGLCCVPDPRDCVHFPGICHPEAACSSKSRQCVCNRGYLGDGISCFPAVSCVTDPYVCHKNALCLPSGHCMCRNGFEGNGHSCREMSALALRSVGHDVPSLCGNKCNKESELCIEGECICKHGFKKIGNVCEDVDECLKSPCHPLAFCQNSKGSYSCSCPEGYVGDGKTCIQHLKIGELGVFCENDGMTLVLSNDTQMFEGKMYVRGQAENPNCVKTFSSLQQHSRPYTFKVFFEHCNVHLLENNTFATTVIVQKHPHFITTSADSYELKCTYSPDIAQVQSHVNVSELSPTSTLSNQFEGPTCFLKITDERNDFVESAKVGQAMVLRLEVAPNGQLDVFVFQLASGTYGILPRDCVAVNIETGERYQLTDRYGCAVDDQLFPEFNQIHPSVTEAIFRTFKWPDSSMIRFQCDCKACVGPCPAPDCQNLHKKMLPRFRRAHHGENEELDEEDADQKVVDTKRKAFSRLLAVHEDAEEQLAQEEVEHWSRGRSVLSESLPAVSQFEAEGVCVRTAVLAMAALLLVLSLGFLTSTALRRRRSTDSKSSDSPISVISF